MHALNTSRKRTALVPDDINYQTLSNLQPPKTRSLSDLYETLTTYEGAIAFVEVAQDTASSPA